MKKAHIKDGVAVTKFMYWLKQNVGKMEIIIENNMVLWKTV